VVGESRTEAELLNVRADAPKRRYPTLLSLRRGLSAVSLGVAVLVAAGHRSEAHDAAGSQAPEAAHARPRLVVFVSVDQMRFDYLTRFAPLFTSGLKRLVEQGAVFSNARYQHAYSETGPGHALLMSGRHGRHTGIIANGWYEPLAGDTVNVVDDPAHRPVPGPGRGASPFHFLGETIGDLLKKVSPASRVVGVSTKDRTAVLMSGRRADAAYWYENATGRYSSSTYYMSALPQWLADWNAKGGADRFYGQTWTRLLDDEAVYLRYAGEDAVQGEWDNVDTTFPHKIRGAPNSKDFYDDLRRTPYSDQLVLEVALLALDNYDMGRDDATDILTVGFSGTDSIGHTYGPDSQELMDQILRLDRTFGRLLEAAEARAGHDGLIVGLSADHGVMPLVEVLRAHGVDARRVHPDTLEKAVKDALAARFPGATDLIADADWDGPYVYLDLAAVHRRGLERSAVEKVVGDALVATGVVSRVYTHSQLLGPPPDDDPEFALFRNSFYEPRSAHVIGRVKPHVYVDDYVGGTGHGTVHDYDRHVPVVFMGAGVRPGRYEAACGPHEIAPTLAAVLGLAYRLEEGQRVLSEAFAPSDATRHTGDAR
jgi:predicted AlkP superfamily pyrophosphatase or phosphodiesterase